MIANTAKPKKNERVAARVVEGKALIVVIDQKQLHTLNEVGAIRRLCAEPDRAVGTAWASSHEAMT